MLIILDNQLNTHPQIYHHTTMIQRKHFHDNIFQIDTLNFKIFLIKLKHNFKSKNSTLVLSTNIALINHFDSKCCHLKLNPSNIHQLPQLMK